MGDRIEHIQVGGIEVVEVIEQGPMGPPGPTTDLTALTSRVTTLESTVATDAELAAAIGPVVTALAAKQDSSTAATDAELAAAVATLNTALAGKATTQNITDAIAAHAAGDATDAELASAVAALTAEIVAADDLLSLVKRTWGGDQEFEHQNIGPVLESPDGVSMRLRTNAAGQLILDPIVANPAPVYIPFIGSAQAKGTGTSITINKPAGVQAGDMMIAVIDNRGSQSITGVPSGWTLINQATGGPYDSSAQLTTYRKVAGSSEPSSYAWTFSGSSIFDGGIAAYRNVASVGSVVATVGSSGEPGLTISSLQPNSRILFAAAVDTAGTGTGSVTNPDGFIQRWDSAQGTFASSHLSDGGNGDETSIHVAAEHSPPGTNWSLQLIALVPSVVDPVALGTLRWAPPVLDNPTTLSITPAGGGIQSINLDPDTDYIIQTPTLFTNGLSFIGGRNVKWIGGEIAIGTKADVPGSSDNTARRALLISGCTGCFHAEGLLLHGVDINEGIDVASPDGVVQIQCVRADNLHAHDEVGFTDNHPDAIQTWGGCKELRVDKFTFGSDYQGVFLNDDFNHSRMVARLCRVNGRLVNSLGQYFFWRSSGSGNVGDVFLEDFYVEENPSIPSIGKRVWPDQDNVSTAFPERCVVDGNEASWPDEMSPGVHGSVIEGVPSGGDFVPTGTPGLGVPGIGYISPGYQAESYAEVIEYVAADAADLAGKLSAGLNLSDLANASTARTNLGLGTAATQASGAFDAAGAAAAAQAASQPLDSDLTAIAALTTTSFGRAFLALADAAAARTAISAAAATHSHAEADITGLVSDLAGKQPLDSDLTAIAALTTTSFGRSFLDRADAAAGRTLLGLVIGTDVQAYDSDLASIAALTTTSFGRAFLALADAAAARTAIGAVIGTDVQAYDAELAAIAGLTSAANKGIQFTGSGTAATFDLTAAGKAILDDADARAQRVTLGAQRVMQILVTDPNGSAITTGDGKAYLRINSLLNGLDLTAVAAHVTTVSSSGIVTVQIANVTDGVDMLSTKLTIDASEKDSSTAAAAAVIDTAVDDVATGDELRIDIDVAGTGAKGLIVELTFA